MEKAKIDIGEVARIMEENEIGDLQRLRKIIKDYDNLCEEVVQLTCVLVLLDSFLKEKGLKEEARKFLKESSEEQFGTNNRGKA